MSKMTHRASALICLLLIMLSTACSRPITRSFDPRLTEPCLPAEFPSTVNLRMCTAVLVEQWEIIKECDDRLRILRESNQP